KVPVAFFNAAIAGASLDNFIESYNGDSTINPLSGLYFCKSPNSAAGNPYRMFKETIEYYNSLFGIRAILFMHGESDTFLGTTEGDYLSKLNSLITISRNEIGQAVPWVVSRTSYYDSLSSPGIINAQNASVNPGNQIFRGPSTDDLIGPTYRDDNKHFSNFIAYNEVAERWLNELTSNSYSGQSFYDLSTPIPAKTQPNITVTINGSNVTLTAPGGYASYKW